MGSYPSSVSPVHTRARFRGGSCSEPSSSVWLVDGVGSDAVCALEEGSGCDWKIVRDEGDLDRKYDNRKPYSGGKLGMVSEGWNGGSRFSVILPVSGSSVTYPHSSKLNTNENRPHTSAHPIRLCLPNIPLPPPRIPPPRLLLLLLIPSTP